VSASKLLPTPKKSSHPVDVGQRTEARIISGLVARGYRVLLPFGTNQRYDLVLDLEGRFVRCQCKTGRLLGGVIVVSTRSVQSNTQRTVCRSYGGGADVFLVHCPGNDGLYCIPVDDAPATAMYLRVEPSLNGQKQLVRWASEYELPA
jgi:hypothetical protein